MTSTTRATAKHHFKLHVLDRGADGGSTVGQHGYLHRRRQGTLELRQQSLDPVHDLDDVGARLSLNIDDNGGPLVHPGCLAHILRIINRIGYVGQPDRSTVPVGDDEGRYSALERSWSFAPMMYDCRGPSNMPLAWFTFAAMIAALRSSRVKL